MSLVFTAPLRFLGLLTALVLAALALALVPPTTALGLGVAGVLATALLLAPEIALYLLIFAVPFGSLLPLTVGNAKATAADGLLALAWALYLARGVVRRRIVVRVPALALPFVLFLLAASVSLTVAPSLPDGLTELAKWIEMLAVYWLVAQEFTERQVVRALVAMFAAGLAQALLGAYQYYFRAGPEGFLLFGGANLRAFGTFDQPNPYAGYLGLIIPLAFGTALGMLLDAVQRLTAQGTLAVNISFLYRLALFALAVVSLGAMLAALFFSYSRGAWIGVAAALATTAAPVLLRSKRATALGIVLGTLVLITALLGEINLLPNVVAERFAVVGDYFGFEDVRGVRANDANFAIVERRAHWQAALEMFAASPWIGIGFGNYAAVYPQYALPKWDDPLGHAHNYYLNVLGEAGLLGFTAYLVLWIALLAWIWRAARSLPGWTQGVGAGALGVLVALSIHNFFDNLFVHAMYLQVGLMLGLVEVLSVEG